MEEPVERDKKQSQKRARALVNAALEDIKSITRDPSFSFASTLHRQRYVGTLSAHFSQWGVPARVAPDVAEKVLKLHRAVAKKVDRFLRENYGHDIYRYDHDLELLRNALLRVYGDASIGLFNDLSRGREGRTAYLNALDATAQAVQPNFAITDHVIREGYTVAPYAAYVREYPHLSQLLDRALRRKYPRVLTDLRHMLDIFFASEHTHQYLKVADRSIAAMLAERGIKSGRVPRQHITPYSAAIVPVALHASLIDLPSDGDARRALLDVSKYLFGPSGKNYLPRLRVLAQDPELYPVLIGIAKHWDRGVNGRLWDAFVQAMKHDKHSVKDLVNTEGRVAWEDLWPHLSKSIHLIRDTADRHDFISLSKLNVLDQLRGLCEQPTCLYPANEQGQRYGVEYVLNPKKGDVMPIVAVAHSVSKKKAGKDRIVGRIIMFADPNHGNIHIVSSPVGAVSLSHYVDAAKRYALEVNRSAGTDIFERVLVGGQGDTRFRIPVDDAYGDMIVKKGGKHYLRDAKIIPLK